MILPRKPNQSWREAAIAQGTKYGLGAEVTAMFDDLTFNGLSEEQAAFDACQSWDVLERET